MGLKGEHQVKLSTRTSTGTYMNQDSTIQKITRTLGPVNQLQSKTLLQTSILGEFGWTIPDWNNSSFSKLGVNDIFQSGIFRNFQSGKNGKCLFFVFSSMKIGKADLRLKLKKMEMKHDFCFHGENR